MSDSEIIQFCKELDDRLLRDCVSFRGAKPYFSRDTMHKGELSLARSRDWWKSRWISGHAKWFSNNLSTRDNPGPIHLTVGVLAARYDLAEVWIHERIHTIGYPHGKDMNHILVRAAHDLFGIRLMGKSGTYRGKKVTYTGGRFKTYKLDAVFSAQLKFHDEFREDTLIWDKEVERRTKEPKRSVRQIAQTLGANAVISPDGRTITIPIKSRGIAQIVNAIALALPEVTDAIEEASDYGQKMTFDLTLPTSSWEEVYWAGRRRTFGNRQNLWSRFAKVLNSALVAAEEAATSYTDEPDDSDGLSDEEMQRRVDFFGWLQDLWEDSPPAGMTARRALFILDQLEDELMALFASADTGIAPKARPRTFDEAVAAYPQFAAHIDELRWVAEHDLGVSDFETAMELWAHQEGSSGDELADWFVELADLAEIDVQSRFLDGRNVRL